MTLLGPNARNESGGTPPGIEWRPPADTRRVLLAGDETALPAVASVLESLAATRPGVTGHALVEVAGAADVLPLAAPSGVRVVWCPRDGRPRGAALAAALHEVLDAPTAARPSTPLADVDVDHEVLWETGEGAQGWYGWLAGEAAMVRGLRRHLVQERGVDRRSVTFMGYWREGRAEG
ncbi:hypothetical protein GCM10025868_40890 [Angustibacter aerolatus]|uniref:SIP-like Rossmann fold domain-containing protein n=1 Tax=Angustibacter aerolatus TaxID=1162965 RepID=A0ABQ6JNC7_9ACTN|nr:siderophore-interacting protein [Angustibacter aerolatus]GMA88839.1 hypothetical protein GCM10025868_40890 [Angustibacter aerolatus]